MHAFNRLFANTNQAFTLVDMQGSVDGSNNRERALRITSIEISQRVDRKNILYDGQATVDTCECRICVTESLSVQLRPGNGSWN